MLKQDIPILTAAQIAQAIDRQEDILHIPEWGGAIRLKALSLDERDRMIALASDNGRPDGKIDSAKLIHLLVIYGVKEPPLTEQDIKDRHPAVIDRIANAVMQLNGMTQEAGLTASVTFRPQPGPVVSVPTGEGPGVNGAAPAA